MDLKKISTGIAVGAATLLIYDIVRGYNALRINLANYEITNLNLNSGTLGINLYFDITNPLLIGVTLREIDGNLTATNYGSDPVLIGTVHNRYNYYIRGKARHMIRATVNLDTKSTVQQILKNIQSGSVENLLITFSGTISFGKGKEVPIPINKKMTLTEFIK